MTITIRINTDNAAFEDAGTEHEVSRILNKLTRDFIAQTSLQPGVAFRLFDVNGNATGTVKVTR